MIALALALAGPHQPTPAEIEMLKCFYEQAAAIDDHISSAAVIAQGVVSACSRQVNEWKYASFAELRPPNAQLFYRRLDQMAPGTATEVVLRVRAAQKARK